LLPRFCPEKVVAADEKELIATFATPVTLVATEQAAIKVEPWAFIRDCISTCPTE